MMTVFQKCSFKQWTVFRTRMIKDDGSTIFVVYFFKFEAWFFLNKYLTLIFRLWQHVILHNPETAQFWKKSDKFCFCLKNWTAKFYRLSIVFVYWTEFFPLIWFMTWWCDWHMNLITSQSKLCKKEKWEVLSVGP